MNSLPKWVGAGFVPVVYAVFLSTMVIAAERAVYDKPDSEVPGTTIYGKVIKVADRDAAKHAWDVSVENAATGEVVQVQLDKTTERKRIRIPRLAIGLL